MKKLKLLLLEDNPDEAIDLCDILTNNSYEIDIAPNIEQARYLISEKHFDIIILDIMIDGKPDGIVLANELSNSCEVKLPFIFLTSINDKAIFNQAKHTASFSYLLKPFNELELLYALEVAIEKHYDQFNTITSSSQKAIVCPNHIFVKKKKAIKKIELSSIYFIEVEEKYCSVITIDDKYTIKLSLKKIKEILPQISFKQVHRNYIINLKHLKEIYFEDNLIIMNNNNKINFSQHFKKIFLKNNTIYH